MTYNRRALLRECLEALRAQTRSPDHVLVVDNASNDGTAEMLETAFPEVETLRLAENVGGAGGFHAGMARAYDAGHDWIWLMDDDTIPTPSALAALVDARGACDGLEPLVLASRVDWSDGTQHPMNKPWPKAVDRAATVEAARNGLLPLRAASFVSLLVNRAAIDRYGLPHAHYFIWNDDLEYTARVLRRSPGFFVPSSIAEHRTAKKYAPQSSSGERFYFDVRNRLWMMRSAGWSPVEKVVLARHLFANTRRYLQGNRFDRAATGVVARGLRDGLRSPPAR